MTSDPATELARLVAGGEGVGVEFKRSLTKDVGRGLCAFANAGGGTVLLGVSDAAKIPESMDRMVALRNLGLLDNDDRMTHAGAWLLARDIRRFTTSAHVSCALFMGTEKVRILDRRDFHGDVPAMVDDAVAWILTKINVELVIRRVRREERPELPEEALREAVANAVAHRDYRSTANVQIYVFKDRIEIVSPGGLPAGVSEADLGVKSMPRNPLLFGMLYRMDVVENIGSGIRRIRDLCREHGVAEPVIDASEHWVTVTLPRPAGLDDGPDIRKTGGEGGRGPESQPEPGPESRREWARVSGRTGLESTGDGLESAGDGLESTGDGARVSKHKG